MADGGQVVIKIDGDNSDAKKSLEQVTSITTSELSKQKSAWQSYADTTGKTFLEIEADIKNLTNEFQSQSNDISSAYKTSFNKLGSYSEDAKNDIERDFNSLETDANKTADSIQADFKSAFSKIGTYSKSAISGLTSFSTSIGKGLATSAAVGTAALAAFGSQAVMLASNLEEVQNVVDVTFGDSADVVNQFALDAAEAFGMSELNAKQFTGTLGAMLKSMGLTDDEVLNMSLDMSGLAGDFASFYNLDHATAFEKIRSGISGETEPLKQLGINMSVANLEAYALAQGITTAYNSMTEAEKATLRYNYLMEVSADAQGDFERTSDSLANQLRIAQLQLETLSATIGTALIPMVNQGVGVLNDFGIRLNDAFNANGAEGLAKEFGSVLSEVITGISKQIPEFAKLGNLVITSFLTSLLEDKDALSSAFMSTIDTIVTSTRELIPQLAEVATLIAPIIAEAIISGYPLLLELGIGIISALVQGIVNNLDTIIISAQTALNKLVEAIIVNLPLLLNGAVQIIMSLAQFLMDNVDLLINSAITIVNTLVTFLQENLSPLIEVALLLVLALVDGIIKATPEIIGAVPEIVMALVDAIMDNLPLIISAGVEIIFALIQGILTQGLSLKKAGLEIAIALIDTLINTDWLQVGKDAVDDIINGFLDFGSGVSDFVTTLWNDLKTAVTQSDWWSLGKDILDGVLSGLSDFGGNIAGAAKGLFDDITGNIANVFGIASPAKNMMPFGEDIGNGIAVGFGDSSENILKTVDDVNSSIFAEQKKHNEMLAGLTEEQLAEYTEKRKEQQLNDLSRLYNELGNAEASEQARILQEISNIQQAYDNEMNAISEASLDSSLDNRLAAFADYKATYEEQLADLADKQNSFAQDLFDQGELFTTDDEGNVKLSSLTEDTRQINEFGNALSKLQDKAIPSDLLAEVTAMGVEEGLAYAEELLNLSNKEYENYINSWNAKKEAAQKVAEEFYANEIETLNSEFVDKIPEELSYLEQDLNTVGADAGESLADGLASKSSVVLAEAQKIADEVSAVFSSIGEMASQGFNGVSDIINGSIMPASSTTSTSNTTNSTSNSNNITIVAPENDPDVIAQTTRELLER